MFRSSSLFVMGAILHSLVIAPALGGERPNEGRARALLVGVNRYGNARLKPLSYAVNDVTELAVELRHSGLEADLLTDDEGDKQASMRPTKANILAALRTVVQATGRNDSILVALAGHGLQFGGDRDSYFCPIDADPNDRRTLLSLSALFQELEACGGKKLVLVDACRDDPTISRGINGAALQLPDEVAALFSCSAGERAMESDRYAHGVFFHHVLQGIKGAAAGRDENVTWDDLSKHVREKVPDDVLRLYGGQVRQTPTYRAGEMAGASPVLRRGTARGTESLVIVLSAIGGEEGRARGTPPHQAIVRSLLPGGGGDRLGLRLNDVILKVDGFHVVTPAEAIAAIKNHSLGAEIEITIQRDGEELVLSGRYETLLTGPQIISRLKQLAEGGDVRAQYHLGFCHANGQFSVKDEAESAAWYRRAAEQGDAMSQAALGEMFREGRGVAKDDREAVVWYRKAAAQQLASAQNALGYMYAKGRGVAKDEKEAVGLYLLAAEQKSPEAENNLGVMYANGSGVERDDHQAVLWYRKAAEQGYALANSNLGAMYASGRGVARDEKRAVSCLREAADKGLALAQNKLGGMYAKGRGVDKDEEEAAKWYRKAAAQGQASAQNNLGWCFQNGLGVPKDDHQAVDWYRKSAEQGDPNGQLKLGWMYEMGRGVPKDDAQAVFWYRKAADQGEATAQNNLGLCYRNGRGVPKDDAQAASWYRKAADKGQASAQCNLGLMYEFGHGVPKDDTQALLWYRKAAAQKDPRGLYFVGWMYEYGRGVQQSMPTAIAWYRSAAAKSYPDALKALQRLNVAR